MLSCKGFSHLLSTSDTDRKIHTSWHRIRSAIVLQTSISPTWTRGYSVLTLFEPVLTIPPKLSHVLIYFLGISVIDWWGCIPMWEGLRSGSYWVCWTTKQHLHPQLWKLMHVSYTFFVPLPTATVAQGLAATDMCCFMCSTLDSFFIFSAA